LLDEGDYSEVIDLATSIISGDATVAEKQEAYALRAEAKLGDSGINVTSLISTLTNTENINSEGNVNYLNTIINMDKEAEDLTSCADDFFQAFTPINIPKILPATTYSADLTNLADRQLLAGIACAMAATKLIVEKFDLDGDNVLEADDDFNNGDSTPRGTDWLNCVSASGKHATDYILEAVEFLTVAITNEDFTVEEVVSEVKTALDQLNSNAQLNGSPTNAEIVDAIF